MKLLAPHVPAAVKAWIDGLKANKIAWNPDTHAWEEINLPDHEVRRRNALHIVEFAVGKAIERSMEVTGSYKELSTLIEEIHASPEAMRLLPHGLFDTIVNSGQSTAEGKESASAPRERTQIKLRIRNELTISLQLRLCRGLLR